MTYEYEEIIPGDIVAVRHGTKGRQEGLVVGSHIDYQVSSLYAEQEENNDTPSFIGPSNYRGSA